MSRLSDADKRLYSLAHYEADESGEVNLETSKSLGGLYTGEFVENDNPYYDRGLVRFLSEIYN